MLFLNLLLGGIDRGAEITWSDAIAVASVLDIPCCVGAYVDLSAIEWVAAL
jgi:hypothetical protein